MFDKNPVCRLLGIQYPVIQAGMVWCSGWELASAVSRAGGLGLLGAGSMSPEVLRDHIRKVRAHTDKPFGVNLPMLGSDQEEKIRVVEEEKITILFTSAGNPEKVVPRFKEAGCIVSHVISSSRTAEKAIHAGVDALVAEGFEAGGHNGREETTSMVLIPAIRRLTQLPLIAAGGMYSGRSLLAAMALGADAIQVGSRFAVCRESSAHERFKQKIFEINEGDTRLILKKLIPVRMVKNELFRQLTEAEESGASRRELLTILGEGKSKKGIFDGDIEEGELEIGQVSSLLSGSQSAEAIIEEIIREYHEGLELLNKG